MRHRFASLLPFLMLAAVGPAQTAAQSGSSNLQVQALSAEPVAPPPPPASTLQVAPRIGIVGEAELSLSDAVRAVLAANRDILLSRLDHQKAQLRLRAAKGYFDPTLGGNGYALHQVNPVASSLGGAVNGAVTQNEIYGDPSLSGTSRWLGTTYKLDYASSRVDNNNTFNTLNPTFPTAVTLNLKQPLLGGLRFDTNRERLAVASKSVTQSEEQFRQNVIRVTTDTIHAYWELDYALRNLDLQVQAVRLAEQQDASNRRQVEQGTLAAIDVVQAQTQMQTFQQNVFSAQNQVTSAENTLKALMLPDRSAPAWSYALRTTSVVDERTNVPSLEEALRQALADRPDLRSGKISVQTSELDARLAREQAKPQVNLTARLNTQGLAGRVVTQQTNLFGTLFAPLFSRVNDLSTLAGLPPLDTSGLGSTNSVPGVFVGGYGQSLSGLTDVRYPTVQVGIEVSLPIGNRTARANSDIAEVARKQSSTQQQQLEMTVEREVRNSLQQLVNTGLLLDAAHRTAALAQQQYDSEQRQFKAGTSTVFLVLQRQTELINARLRQIRATADNGEAQADFDRATANTLHRQGIEVATQDQLRQK